MRCKNTVVLFVLLIFKVIALKINYKNINVLQIDGCTPLMSRG